MDRLEEACKEELSSILQREIKDPRVGFVTITGVELTPDLRHARVYISVLGSDEEIGRTLDGLRSAGGYLRSRLGEHLHMKYLPEIEFQRDRGPERAQKLSMLMEEASRSTEEPVLSFEEEDVAEAARLIAGYDSATVIGHRNPDGDAIGSALGMGVMLEAIGYDVQVTWPEPFELPVKFDFMPADSLVRPGDVVFDGLVIAVDCANAGRMEELEAAVKAAPAVVNIDHHPDNSLFGGVNLVDSSASATAQIIYQVAPGLGLEVDLEAGICLYAGIVTDTGRFQFSNTSASTLRTAAELVDSGVNPNDLFQKIYQRDSIDYVRLSGEVRSRVSLDEETGLVYAFISQEELDRHGVAMVETEDLIDDLRTLAGHRIAALFKELESGDIRVSLRSRRDIDIGAVARRLGGGGHRVAAGYTSRKRDFSSALEELRGELLVGGLGADT